MATFILGLLSWPYLFNRKFIENRGNIPLFLAGLIFFSLPTILFYLLYTPSNQTFINGLITPSHPANVVRAQMIGMFLLVELVSNKWNGLWIILAAGLLMSKGRCLKGSMSIVPIFLLFYGLVVATYYFINTYFEIGWWLQVSLNRVLFALLPTVIYWVFGAVWGEAHQKS